jgi:hypothetical protein
MMAASCIMSFMSSDIKITAIEEDFESVARHAFNREPLDPEVARRVQDRAAHVTEKLRLTHGVIDDATFESLLEDE